MNVTCCKTSCKSGGRTLQGLTWGMRCRKASPLSVPTASATRKLRRNLKKTLFMSGMRTTPSRDSRLMMVMERNPPTHAATQTQASGTSKRCWQKTPHRLCFQHTTLWFFNFRHKLSADPERSLSHVLRLVSLCCSSTEAALEQSQSEVSSLYLCYLWSFIRSFPDELYRSSTSSSSAFCCCANSNCRPLDGHVHRTTNFTSKMLSPDTSLQTELLDE